MVKRKIKAGSLSYALIVTSFVGVVLLFLIFFTKNNETIFSQLERENNFIDFSATIINYGVSNFNELNEDYKRVSIKDAQYEVDLKRSRWGMLNVLQFKSYFKRDTIKQTFFLGKKSLKNKLVLSNSDKYLSLSGTSNVNADLYIPYEEIKELHLGRKNRLIHKGNLFKAPERLPKMVETINNRDFTIGKNYSLDDLKKPMLSNEFFNETIIIDVEGQNKIQNLKLSGNIILVSKDSLFLSKTNEFEDIIIKSPKVVIEKGFEGSVQIFSTNEVAVQENVFLKYPSVVMVDSKLLDGEIIIGENSFIYGNVVYKTTNESSKGIIKFEEKSTLIGDVYSMGSIDLKAEVFGSVYANNFRFKTDESNYYNTINDLKLLTYPTEFLTIAGIEEKESEKWKVIKRRN